MDMRSRRGLGRRLEKTVSPGDHTVDRLAGLRMPGICRVFHALPEFILGDGISGRGGNGFVEVGGHGGENFG